MGDNAVADSTEGSAAVDNSLHPHPSPNSMNGVRGRPAIASIARRSEIHDEPRMAQSRVVTVPDPMIVLAAECLLRGRKRSKLWEPCAIPVPPQSYRSESRLGGAFDNSSRAKRGVCSCPKPQLARHKGTTTGPNFCPSNFADLFGLMRRCKKRPLLGGAGKTSIEDLRVQTTIQLRCHEE
jgi:hypothetical protein